MARLSKHFHMVWLPAPCSRCGGTGIYHWATSLGTCSGPCWSCGGTGKTRSRQIVWDTPNLSEAQKEAILSDVEQRKAIKAKAKSEKRSAAAQQAIKERREAIIGWLATLTQKAQALVVFATEQREEAGQVSCHLNGGNVLWAVDNRDPSIEEIANQWPTVWQRYQSIRHPYGKNAANTKCRFVGTVMDYFGNGYLKLWITEIDGAACGFIAKIKDRGFKQGKETYGAEIGDDVEFWGLHGTPSQLSLQHPNTNEFLFEAWINRTSRAKLITPVQEEA